QMRSAGATFVRLSVSWRETAPVDATADFTPTNPADPAYRWQGADAEIGAAVAAGLDPIVNFVDTPTWALRNRSEKPGIPIAREVAQVARAAAARYSGSFQGLPRVRYWQIW